MVETIKFTLFQLMFTRCNHIIVAAMCIKFRFHADLFTLRFILFVCLERGHKKIIGKVLKSVTTLREMFEIPRIERKNKKP